MDASFANILSNRWLDYHGTSFLQLPTKTYLFIGAEFKTVAVGLDHRGLICYSMLLYHSGTTFYTLLWKTHILQAIGLNPSQGLRYFVLKWNNISPKLSVSFINLTPQKILQIVTWFHKNLESKLYLSRPFGLIVANSNNPTVSLYMNIFAPQNG